MTEPGFAIGEMFEDLAGAAHMVTHATRWGYDVAREAVSAVSDELVRPALDMSYQARMLRWQGRLDEPEPEIGKP